MKEIIKVNIKFRRETALEKKETFKERSSAARGGNGS